MLFSPSVRGNDTGLGGHHRDVSTNDHVVNLPVIPDNNNLNTRPSGPSPICRSQYNADVDSCRVVKRRTSPRLECDEEIGGDLKTEASSSRDVNNYEMQRYWLKVSKRDRDVTSYDDVSVTSVDDDDKEVGREQRPLISTDFTYRHQIFSVLTDFIDCSSKGVLHKSRPSVSGANGTGASGTGASRTGAVSHPGASIASPRRRKSPNCDTKLSADRSSGIGGSRNSNSPIDLRILQSPRAGDGVECVKPKRDRLGLSFPARGPSSLSSGGSVVQMGVNSSDGVSCTPPDTPTSPCSDVRAFKKNILKRYSEYYCPCFGDILWFK